MKIDLGVINGRQGTGEPAQMDIEELLATRLLVQGNSGSGKSHLLRRLLEQSAPLVQQVIIDPEGDFVSLSEVYGHVVIDANRSPNELEVIAQRVREKCISVVLNLESLESDQQMYAAGIFLNALFDAPREHWYPALVVVDEAQLFAPSASGEASDESRKVSLGAMTNLMCRGRKRGLCGIIATQRLAKLAKNVAAEASNFLMGRTFLDIDMARAVDLLGMDKREAEKFRELQKGHFIALGPALSRRPLPIQVGGVQTQARGSTPKLSSRPETSVEDANAFVLAPVVDANKVIERRAPSMQPSETSTEQLLAAVANRAVEKEADALDQEGDAPRPQVVDAQLVYHKAAADVMIDTSSFMEPDASLYQQFQTLIRIQRLGVPIPQLPEFRKYLSIARAGVPVIGMGEAPWPEALKLAFKIPEDLRSLYLLHVRMAIQGRPAPSDATIARICGTASMGRAVRRLSSLENDGYLVVRTDMKGNRVVNVPDLGIETLPGDPKAPDVFEAPESAAA